MSHRRSLLFKKTTTSPSYPLGNIISEWKFEGNVIDTVGSNNGTATNLSYVAGLVGQAGDFTGGTNSQVLIPDDNTLSFGDGSTDSPFSISFLYKLDVNNTNNFIFKGDTSTATTREYVIQYAPSSGGKMSIIFYDGNLSHYIRAYTTGNIPLGTIYLGQWVHFVITYDGSGTSSGIKLYFQGEERSMSYSSAGTYVAMENTATPLSIGKNPHNTNNSLNGYMDCLRFWDKELTSDEALDIATAELAGIDINP